MYELWIVFEGGWTIRGQYATKGDAVRIGKDYLSRGFRAQVRHDEKVVWESGYNPRCAVK